MFVLVLIVLILFPGRAQAGAEEGLRVAFETVIPSILPFSVVSCALVYSGMTRNAARFLAPLSGRLGLNPYGVAVFLTGLLGGYPTGCKMVCDLYKEGLEDREECERMLSYVNNGGLIFALDVCGGIMFKSKRAGLVLFAVSAVSAFITALVLGRSNRREIRWAKKEKPPFMATLGRSVASGGGVVLNVVSSFVVFYAVSNALGLERVPFLEGCAEMTRGITYAGGTGNLPLATFFFTLGGVGVFSQSAAICSEYSLSMRGYVKGKIVSSAIAFLIMGIIVNRPFFGKEIAVLSLCAVTVIVIAVRTIKKLYAEA